MSEHITTPVGRLVEGSLYKGNEFDADNKPLIYKSGKNTGQPRTDFYFALAIPKGNETNWDQTEWGQVIKNVAMAAFPKTWNRHDFSWKITDGDSTVLNKANRRPCDKEGFAGHWIVRFSRPFSPKIYNADGSKPLLDEDIVNLGDYIQVRALVAGNMSDKTPGVYINHIMVAFSGYGERIVLGPDPKTVGFGQAPLPAGASPIPVAAFSPDVAVAEVATLAPGVVPHANHVVPAAPAPYPQILNAPASPVWVMTHLANGVTYDQYKAAGWTDEQMISGGLVVVG